MGALPPLGSQRGGAFTNQTSTPEMRKIQTISDSVTMVTAAATM